MLNILLVEDNFDLGAIMMQELERNGYSVTLAHDGEDASNLFEQKHFDLVITDIMMPRKNGIELIEHIRSVNKNIPILIVSAKASQKDKYQGFLAGTDDYMVKPIDIDELVMRVNALLRRAKILNDKNLVIGGATLDYDTLSVTIDGKSSVLPQKEFQILFKLLSYPNVIFTRIQLMEEFWDMDTESDEMTIYTHIHRLREKYQNCPYFEIATIRGLGYKAVIK